MGNVLAKAAGIVVKVVNKVKKAIGYAVQKAAEAVHRFFKPIKEKLIEFAGQALMRTIRFHVNHPRLFKIILGINGAALVGLALSPVVLSVALPAFGFTNGGIVAGSLAAAWHSSIGNAVAYSLFAILQSAAAGGYGVAIGVGTLTAAGGLGGIICSLMGSDFAKGFSRGIGDAAHRFLGGSGRGSTGPGPGPGPGPAPAPAASPAASPANLSTPTSESGPDGHFKQE